jgi:ferric-dicitrate binding protein FerR (iron transport regulator)
MFDRHVSDRLAPYLDGGLSAAETRRVEAHLERCSRCRTELEQAQSGAGLIRHLPEVAAPESVWRSIEAGLDLPAPQPSSFRFTNWRFVTAALVASLAAGAGAYWYFPRQVRWEVERVDGAPTVGSIGVGEWLETDGSSRARIKVGEIGSLEVEPNSRIRMTVAQPNEHRLTLARGEISAEVSAPPRLFFVDTASSTAVDLGCAYTMKVNENGFGLLRVTLGRVSLEWGGRESLVPAGASCQTRPHIGPGTPYVNTASELLQEALSGFDFDQAGSAAISVIVAEARLPDTLTLWHMLSRVDESQRPRVLDAITAMVPLPAWIDREKTLKLDPESLRRLKDELAANW